MYGARMIARQCITVSGVKTELLLSVTIVVNGEEGGVGTLGSESFPTCLPLRLASRGPCEALSYLLDKFRERFSNGAVTGPPHKQNKTKQTEKILVSNLLAIKAGLPGPQRGVLFCCFVYVVGR